VASAVLAACGGSSSQSSSSAAAASSTASTTTATSSASTSATASGSTQRCRRLLASSSPKLTPGSAPSLASLEAKALKAEKAAFSFSGQTCAAPNQIISLTGQAQLQPTLVVDGTESVAGRSLEVRFIGSKIYIYLAQIASRDGGKPWLAADLKKLSQISGLDFSQLLDEVRQLSPGGASPLLKAASSFKPIGRATIDGQAVYAYSGSFAPDDLSKLGLPGQLGKQTGAKLKQLGATEERVTTYVTADAVPLRTVTAILKADHSILTVSTNSSQRLGHPITVSAPPADKTIAYEKIAGSGA
jgi:hypothetical protein